MKKKQQKQTIITSWLDCEPDDGMWLVYVRNGVAYTEWMMSSFGALALITAMASLIVPPVAKGVESAQENT